MLELIQPYILEINEKGITISDTELEILIEASVNGFKNGLKGTSE